MRRKNVALLGVAVALFGAAGLVHFLNNRPPPRESARPAAPAAVDLNQKPEFVRNNILVRELMRQALFVAERDERGLATRDSSLREGVAGTAPAARGLAVHAFVRAFDGIQVQLFRDANGQDPGPAESPVPAAAGRQILFQSLIPLRNGDQIDYPALVEQAEALARGPFKEAVGVWATTAPAGGAPEPVSLSADVEQQLGRMDFVSQFAAVRSAHAAARAGGASADAAAVGALVRGYANLGRLTAFEWSSASKAFTARSLLYAQRMVVAATGGKRPAGELANALRHRAYALALGGLQGAALEDLDRAEQLDPPQAAGRPAWIATLRPFCRYQPGELADLAAARPADAPLALFLCFLTVERCNSASVTNGYGQVVLAASPDCLQVLDAMANVSGVSANHVLTELSPAALARSLQVRLPDCPGLPPAVRTALDAAVKAGFDPQSARAVTAALIDAGDGDTGEPSWAVLGRLVEDAQFVHVERRARFMREQWAVDPDDFLAAARPLYRDHPYHGLIECYELPRPPAPDDLAARLKDAAAHVGRQQPTYSMAPLFYKLQDARLRAPNRAPSFWNWQGQYADFNSTDLERYLTERVLNEPRLEHYFMSALHRVSPHAPIYMAKMIQADWDRIPGRQLDQWKRGWGSHPIVAAALAKKYTELKQWAEAERFLRACLAKAADQLAYEMLADNFLAQGDESDWLATLKARLRQPDYALDHARTNNLIARHYMAQQKWAEARPYADAAAQSYAAWALMTAAECYDGLGDHAKAAAIRAAIAQRYGRPNG